MLTAECTNNLTVVVDEQYGRQFGRERVDWNPANMVGSLAGNVSTGIQQYGRQFGREHDDWNTANMVGSFAGNVLT